MSCLQSSHLVKLLRISVFFIRSCLQVWSGHLFNGHLNNPRLICNLKRIKKKFHWSFSDHHICITARHSVCPSRCPHLRTWDGQLRRTQPCPLYLTGHTQIFRSARATAVHQLLWSSFRRLDRCPANSSWLGQAVAGLAGVLCGWGCRRIFPG